MNFRWFSLEEICHGMIIGGNEKEERSLTIVGGGGRVLVYFILLPSSESIQIAYWQKDIPQWKHPLVSYAELYEL